MLWRSSISLLPFTPSPPLRWSLGRAALLGGPFGRLPRLLRLVQVVGHRRGADVDKLGDVLVLDPAALQPNALVDVGGVGRQVVQDQHRQQTLGARHRGLFTHVSSSFGNALGYAR